ncbi:MAG: ankyrin repeat domain-containing protein [Candidatus Cloacimonetes bacterium]|nr:ankyrin repeat domain-containing protein [Candidatus Cloacimonadota bacterium]
MKFFKKILGWEIANFLSASSMGNITKVKEILSKGMNINALQNTTFESALSMATRSNQLDMLEFLLQNGADPNIPVSAVKQSCLYLAAEYGHTEVAKILIKYGANPNIVVDWVFSKHTALSIARKKRHIEIIKLLEEIDAKE